MAKYDVYGMCNSIVDILVQSDDRLIKRLGLNKGVMRLVDVEESQKILSVVKEKAKQITPGGSGCNTMIGIANLGGRAAFSNVVGDDEYGKAFEEQLTKLGVVSHLKKKHGMTGTSVIIITKDSERTMNTCLGVCKQFAKGDLNEGDLLASSMLYLTGYLIDTAPEAGYHALNLAKAKGIPIAFDVADQFLVRAKKEEFSKLIKDYCDIVFLNKDEARLFTGKEPEDAIREISLLCKTVVVKVGSEGSLVCSEGKLYKIAPFKVKAVDTTGAGDMYAAGFLFGITQGYSIEESGKIASFAASRVVQAIGARLDYSLKEEVKKLLG
jgi:sugar/nucleoside kinase (ribokinase family)